jgi:hypothetical protein
MKNTVAITRTLAAAVVLAGADVEQTPHPFGAIFPGITTWTWDAFTQKGSSRTEQTVDACGDPAGDVFDEHSFTLAKS